jgi:hypothetical protein
LNSAIVRALIDACSGASSSVRMLRYAVFSSARALSIVTPGRSRPKMYSQYHLRSSKPDRGPKPGSSSAAIDNGAKIRGRTPCVVPSKPRGATPTTVSVRPFTIIVLPTTLESPPSSVSQ